jgi:hypothetical protein
MARTINQINKQITDAVQADTVNFPADFRNNPSQVARWKLWTYIQAVAIALFEQLLDLFKADIESKLPAVALANGAWLQNQIMNVFQYDATVPQVLICDATTDFVPTYGANKDSTKLLCTRCSIVNLPNPAKTIEIKVAKQSPPVALSNLELAVLGVDQISTPNSFLSKILPAGTAYNCISVNPDRLYIAGIVYFNGAYNATIHSSVIDAINNYISTLDFNGKIKLSDIENVIKNLSGVIDVNLTLVQARRSTGSIGQNIIYDLITGVNNLTYQLYSGWAIEEDTAGQTWSDTLTFTAN